MKILIQQTLRKYAYALHNNIPGGPAYPIRAIRDKRYKLILNLTPEVPYRQNSLMNSKSIVWSEWEKAGDLNEYGHFLYNRLVTRPAIEFYDTEVDPFEMNNLAGEKKHRRRIAKMTEALHKWMAQQGDKGVLMDVEFVNPKYD